MIKFPYCKINIGLEILRKRDDGYHDIRTVMYPVPWTDILEIVPAAGATDTLTVTGNAVDCPPEQNLVMKAVRALREVAEFPPYDIYLHKIIPDGAGLGGGSSDAAIAVVMLNDMPALGLSDEDMAMILSRVGSDCPFFIYDMPMLCEGRGEIMTPVELDLRGWHLVIAKPENAHVSTARAYAGVTPCVPQASLAEAVNAPVEEWRTTVKNAFEPSVFAAAPVIALVKSRMQQLGAAYTSMSGSGAAVYGLFREPVPEEIVRAAFAGCATFCCRL